jgi:hypothetical protein
MATSSSPKSIAASRTLQVARRAGGAQPFFEDDFASGDSSRSTTSDASLFNWAPISVSVDSTRALVGSNSAKFVFGPDADGADSWRELAFSLGKSVSEIWIEYDLYVPSNFAHRSQPIDNNKFLQLNFNGSTYQALTIEFVRQSDTTSGLKRFLSATENPANGSDNWPTAFSTQPNFIGAGYNIEPGQWSQVRVHFKSSTDGTTADGIAELWINGVLVRSLSWPFWKISTGGQINGGYILGYSNSGYAEATEFRADDVKIYETNPGWI